ncbi:nucleotidyltransferase family protein [Mycolicibacterium llatzerense]|uniref:hypothetical protein n=1 Tax=Mycolicibacterium llatzerense TaxID=280871 RepID=UPI0021B69A94|nr:hypothetical protein [Mycolicibacterium llatzerense]MCT7361686.1 hypothetical protein [Mycolicibacterium llatzerense]
MVAQQSSMAEQINEQIARYRSYEKKLLKIATRIEATINNKIQADLKNPKQRERQYYRGSILVYSRVKSEESIRDRLKDRHSTLESFPDLIGCRIVVVQRAEIADIKNLLSHQFDGYNWEPMNYYDGIGRGRGYSGLSLDKVPIVKWVSEHVKSRAPRLDIPEDLKWELQIHTAMEEAWSRYSHAGFYKSPRGIPSELQQRMYQLSAAARLIDDSLRQTSLEVRERQNEIINKFEPAGMYDSKAQIAALDLDECVLYGCQEENTSYQHLYDQLRDIGRIAGFRISEYEDTLKVKVGDETVVALEICQRAEIHKFGHFERLLRLFSQNKELLGAILHECFPSTTSPDVKQALFDRPLLVFAILVLFNMEDYPRVYEILPPLRDYIKENRQNYRDKAGQLADTIRAEISLKEHGHR